jgi:uncharacterized protein YukE
VTEGFWIDPDVVRSAAPGFEHLGTRLDQIFANLRARLEAEGHCWGGDDYGKAFEKDYVPARDNAIQFFPQLAQGLEDVGAGLAETADTARRGEDATHQKFTT